MNIQHSHSQTFKGSWAINENPKVYQTDNAGDRHCWDDFFSMGQNTILDSKKANRIKNLMMKSDPRHPNDEKDRVTFKRPQNDGRERTVSKIVNKKGQRAVNPNPPDERMVKSLSLVGQRLVLYILGTAHTAKIINTATGKEIIRFSCNLNPKKDHIEALHKDSKPLSNPDDDLYARILAMIGQNKKGDNND